MVLLLMPPLFSISDWCVGDGSSCCISRFINNGHDSDEQQNEGSSSSFRPQLASVDSIILSIFMIGSMATVCKMPRRNM